MMTFEQILNRITELNLINKLKMDSMSPRLLARIRLDDVIKQSKATPPWAMPISYLEYSDVGDYFYIARNFFDENGQPCSQQSHTERMLKHTGGTIPPGLSFAESYLIKWITINGNEYFLTYPSASTLGKKFKESDPVILKI
jgi:hypothetical protein